MSTLIAYYDFYVSCLALDFSQSHSSLFIVEWGIVTALTYDCCLLSILLTPEHRQKQIFKDFIYEDAFD